MFYDNLHVLFQGRIATGKHAILFSPPPAVPIVINKRAFDPLEWKEDTGDAHAFDDIPGGGAFNNRAEESPESEKEEDENVLSPEYFKRLEAKRAKAAKPGPSPAAVKAGPAAVKASPAVALKSGPARQLREKPVEQVSRMLGTIVHNQNVLLNRLPTALKLFDDTYATALTIMQKIKVKSFLGKENHAEIFTLLAHDERTEFINEIVL